MNLKEEAELSIKMGSLRGVVSVEFARETLKLINGNEQREIDAEMLRDTIATLTKQRRALINRTCCLEKALTEHAAEHEEQAECWRPNDFEGGDEDNYNYHKKWAKHARKALK